MFEKINGCKSRQYLLLLQSDLMPVIICASGSNNRFTNVNIVPGGLLNVRPTATNVSGNSSLAKMVIDVPA